MSTIIFRCSCGKKLAADGKYAGRNMNCPSCGAGLAVPAAGTSVPLVKPDCAVEQGPSSEGQSTTPPAGPAREREIIWEILFYGLAGGAASAIVLCLGASLSVWLWKVIAWVATGYGGSLPVIFGVTVVVPATALIFVVAGTLVLAVVAMGASCAHSYKLRPRPWWLVLSAFAGWLVSAGTSVATMRYVLYGLLGLRTAGWCLPVMILVAIAGYFGQYTSFMKEKPERRTPGLPN